MTVQTLQETIESITEALEKLRDIKDHYVSCEPDMIVTEEDHLDIGEILVDLEKDIYDSD